MSYVTYTYIKKYPVVIAQTHMHSSNWNACWKSALLKHTHTHTNRLIEKLMNEALLLRGQNTVTIVHSQPHTHQSIFPSSFSLIFAFTQHPLANFHFVTAHFLLFSLILILSSYSVLVTLLLSLVFC